MNVETHHASKQFLKNVQSEPDPRLARLVHKVYLAKKGHSCSEIVQIIGSNR